MTSTIRSKPLRYFFSILITLATVALQYWIVKNAKVAAPGFLYSACFLIAWFFGYGPAVAAILVATISSAYFFYQPFISNPDDVIRLGIFSLTTLIVAKVIARGRKAERGFKDLQSLFDRSIEASDLGLWYYDLNTHEIVFSRKAREQFGISETEKMTAELMLAHVHPDDLERVKAAIEKSRDLSAYDIEYRTYNPAEPTKIRWLRVMGWVNYEIDSRPNRYEGIILDNTRAKEIAIQRDESLEVIETVNRVGKTLSAELDLERLVQSVTDAATQLSKAEFGAFFYNVIDEKGEAFALYTISGVPKEAFADFGPTFRGEEVVRSDDINQDPRYLKSADHSRMPKTHLSVVSYLAVPVISRSGKVLGGLFFGHSKAAVFTEREEKLVVGLAAQAAVAMDNAALFEDANRAIRLRDEFLSISSHELRTPLTPLRMQIEGISRLLEKGTLQSLSEDRLKRMVVSADRQITRMVALIDDLLDVSRISTGKLKLNPEPVELVELIQEVIERYSASLRAVHCEIKLDLPASLSAQVDRLRFEQILINLLTNAMRYAAEKPIFISLNSEGDDLVMTVTDQGVGISAEDQKRIFWRFERGSSSTNYGGLGLGLFIVQQIVSAHGGVITVSSELEKGASFKVRIPQRKVHS